MRLHALWVLCLLSNLDLSLRFTFLHYTYMLCFIPSISICDSIALVMKCSHFASISIWSLAVVHVDRLVDVRPYRGVPAPYQCHGNISDTITCVSYPRHSMHRHGSSTESMNSHALRTENKEPKIETQNFGFGCEQYNCNIPLANFSALYARIALPRLSWMSLSPRMKMPCFGLHVKYVMFCTVPSFLPIGVSSSTPIQVPVYFINCIQIFIQKMSKLKIQTNRSLTEKCVGPMKLITPEWLYGRINTDSFSAIQSGSGVSLCMEPVISFESESLWLAVLAGLPSSSMYCVFGICDDDFWLLLWCVMLLGVHKMFWLLSPSSSPSSTMMMFLFSSFWWWCCCCSCCVSDNCVVVCVCSSWMLLVCDVGVSFMNGLKRFWPLPGVYGVVVNCEFCFGGDEPVRSKSLKSKWKKHGVSIWIWLDEYCVECYLEFRQRSSSAMTLCHRLWDCYCWPPETHSMEWTLTTINSFWLLVHTYTHNFGWWQINLVGIPVIRSRWMWTMSCWACLDWFVYCCFAHLLRFFARFLAFVYWWLSHYWSYSPNYTSIDSYCTCHATSPSSSTSGNVISTAASERPSHRTDLIRNHCNSLPHPRWADAV